LSLVFEPLDRGQIEVVGRLVEQEDVGRRGQRVGKRRAPPLAAREPHRVLAAVEPKLLEQIAGLVRVVARAKPSLHIG